MIKKSFKISGMSCSSCVQSIESFFKKNVKEAKDVKINFASSTLYLKTSLSDKKIQEILSSVGNYKIVNKEEDFEENELKRASSKMKIALFFSGTIMLLMMLMMTGIYAVPYYFFITLALAVPVIFIAGWETHKSALESLKNLKPNMDTLVTLGSLFPFFLSFLRFLYPEMLTFIEMASTILALHLVGRFLEIKARGKASQSIKKLLEMGAKKALILVDGKEEKIDIEDLKVGDLMVIKPGEKVPTDGVVFEGSSYIDESMATGESKAVKKEKGDKVIGATINKGGHLIVVAEKIGDETFLSQVIMLVEECQGSSVPIQEFADRVTGYFVPFVLLLSITSFLSWIIFPEFHIAVLSFFNFPWVNTELETITLAILSMTAVLVISCPCALGLATPTALMVGSGIGAEKGILIRNGEAIQTMKDVRAVLFDKTGTLTKGRPEVTDIITKEEYSKKDALEYAASIETLSEHPLAGALVEGGRRENVEIKKVQDFYSVSGKGVVGKINGKEVVLGNEKMLQQKNIDYGKYISDQKKIEEEGKTTIFVALDKEVIGLIGVADTLKEESKNVIAKLKEMGLKTVMLTGDSERTAKSIGEKIGVDVVVANLLPADKVREVQKIQEKYKTVIMVGDGINDAPALKQANIGIALGTGTDIAIESADVTLVTGNLDGVISAIKLSNKTFQKIKENYFWAWLYNGIAIPFAFFGVLHPIIGALAMALSSINVILNSLRLKKIKL